MLVGILVPVIVHLWLKNIDPVVVSTLPDGGSYSGK